jgi:hypothetical protein
MTNEEQWQWVNEQMVRDPYWADTESTIRRQAVEVHERLRDEGGPVRVGVMVRSRDAQMGMRSKRIDFSFSPTAGAVENTLLIEEILRRAMYDDRDY